MDIVKIQHIVETTLWDLMKDVEVGGHNFRHFEAVRDHAIEAVKCEPNLSERQKIQIELAAFLHDADDEKIFSKNYNNARKILSYIEIEDKEEFIEGIIAMIDLVSCSKNGDKEPLEPWMAIPRDCDRLEAIGSIGIERCREFTLHKQAPFSVDSTLRAYTPEEVWVAATPERFTAYMNGAKSASMIDHYYDKLLHIGQSHRLRSQNPYILREAATRNDIMVQYVIDYWTYYNKSA